MSQLQQPDGDPIAEAGQKVTQLTMMATMVARETARLAQQRAAQTEQARRAAAAELAADYAEAQTQWAPAFDRDWLGSAETVDTARVWAAAAPWAEAGDDEASQAMQAAEQRLRTLHPEAMRGYDDARAAGETPHEAMHRAAPQMAPTGDADAANHASRAWPGQAAPESDRLDTSSPQPDRAPVRVSYPRDLREGLTAPHLDPVPTRVGPAAASAPDSPRVRYPQSLREGLGQQQARGAPPTAARTRGQQQPQQGRTRTP